MPEGAGRRPGLAVRLRQDGPIPLDAVLTVDPGELVALVGPSGAGKTTILRAVAGLYAPREGQIACGGVTWLDTAAGISMLPQARAVGLVFQSYALFPHMSALGNVAAALGHLPRRRRDARARTLLDLVRLAGLEDRLPAQLSGGQQQRVALARALARDPSVLLLDEPFSAVDQVTRRKLRRELVLLRRSVDVPILIVTHDLVEAQTLADRMVVLSRGRTLQAGPPHEIMTRPSSAEVARLVDLDNLFAGVVAGHDRSAGVTHLRWCSYTLEAPYSPGFAPGSEVAWLIPPGSVVLHRRDRPSRGEHENPVRGEVDEVASLGDQAQVVLRVDGLAGGPPLAFSVPLHVAARNGLAPGVAAAVSLLRDGIHIIGPGRPSPDDR